MDVRTGQGEPAPSDDARADVGVLFVHGIGDHREGETLTTFGEPLIDWIKEWLRAGCDRNAFLRLRGQVSGGEADVTAARLQALRTEADSPAIAQLDLQEKTPAGDRGARERWLMCEAWWGGTVQPPPSLRLLGWMWTRGPLLIYWHVYLGASSGEGRQRPQPVVLASWALAFTLALVCQLLVLAAITLYVIPIGPWRRAVVGAVRALTLTLGDSYVLMENEIQRGALVERTRRTLAWLQQRCRRIAVIAHSQGGAIAHEALRTHGTDQVSLLLSIGSGLEKLQFLRLVRTRRSALLSAGLIGPLAVLGTVLLALGLGGGPRVVQAAGYGALLGAFITCVMLAAMLEQYRIAMRQEADDAALPGLARGRWLDVHATHDLVPMGKHSIFSAAPFLFRREVSNQRSILNDHTDYFANRGDLIPLVWRALSTLSSLRLFSGPERVLLKRYAQVHAHQARVLGAAKAALLVAAIVLVATLYDQLVNFGGSIQQMLTAGWLGDGFKPVSALVQGLAAALALGWPGGLAADKLAKGLYGVALLAGALVLWWSLFKGFWRLRCAARWRRACQRRAVLASPQARLGHYISCALFGLVGMAPLIVAVLFVTMPEALTARSLAAVTAATLAGLVLLVAASYLVAAPWLVNYAFADDEVSPVVSRLTATLSTLSAWLFFLYLAYWLYPPLANMAWILAMAFAVGAVAWLVFAVTTVRAQRGARALVPMFVVPPAAVFLAAALLPAATREMLLGIGWAATSVAGLLVVAWPRLPRLAREAIDRLRRRLVA